MSNEESYLALFDLEQKLRAVEAFERILVERGSIPDAQKLLIRRVRVLMEVFGALLLGLFSAVMAVLVVFVVMNKALHI